MMEMLTGDALASGPGVLLGTLTVVFVACFVGWTAWAYNPKNRARMDAAAQIPFEDGETP